MLLECFNAILLLTNESPHEILSFQKEICRLDFKDILFDFSPRAFFDPLCYMKLHETDTRLVDGLHAHISCF